MLLRGEQGTELELQLVGYEHPREETDPWESNSLLVSVRVIAPQGSWEVVDPCLTTWEAAHVVRWCAALAARADLVANRPLGISEPNVAFTGRARRGHPDHVDVRACFALELRPPWVRAVAGTGDLCVDLEVGRDQLAAAARALAADLDRFPQRGHDPTL
jgi:hypothetical protein